MTKHNCMLRTKIPSSNQQWAENSFITQFPSSTILKLSRNHAQYLKTHKDGLFSASAILFHQDTQFPCWPITMYVSAKSEAFPTVWSYKTSFQIT